MQGQPHDAPPPDANRLDRLRGFRNRPDRDQSLSFMAQAFKQQVERPYKQLHAIAELWRELVPGELVQQTRLDGLSRGILRVSVSSSAHHYELDRLLRGGLERELVRRHTGPAFRRIKVSVSASAKPAGPG